MGWRWGVEQGEAGHAAHTASHAGPGVVQAALQARRLLDAATAYTIRRQSSAPRHNTSTPPMQAS